MLTQSEKTKLAYSQAKKWGNIGEELEDRIQIAYEAIIKAEKAYKPESGLKFSTLACTYIRMEFMQYWKEWKARMAVDGVQASILLESQIPADDKNISAERLTIFQDNLNRLPKKEKLLIDTILNTDIPKEAVSMPAIRSIIKERLKENGRGWNDRMFAYTCQSAKEHLFH